MTTSPARNHTLRRAFLAPWLRAFAIALVVLCGVTAGAPYAAAQSLDAARASGMVGEKYDGYAVARDSATPAVRSLVNSVNNQRRAIYAREAKSKNISVDQVGKFFASQIAGKAPKGTWFLSQSGSWQQK